ncbi:hypothetical protein AALI21_02750 [Corynebacteriaceae bacterium 6-324]
MVQIPEKYGSKRSDVEALVLDYLATPLADCSPPGHAVTALPDTASSTLDEGGFFVLATRTGGGVPPNQRVRDDATIAVSIIAETRRDSWAVANMIYTLFDAHRPGDGGIAEVTELVGPVQSPFANPDRRMVTIYFTVTAMKSRR